MGRIRFAFIAVSIISMLVINGVYYITTRETLEQIQEEKIDLTANHIRSSIYTSNQAEKYFNLFLAQELRKSAIAIKYALPSTAKDVTNQELSVLAEELNLEGINLFVKSDNDIVVEKSSNPEEIGLSGKSLEGWYEMYEQLYSQYDVNYVHGFGETLENFWSGPIEKAVRNPDLISKWGYFYDGTTDYIISPFIDDKLIQSFKKESGVNQSIVRATNDHNFIKEITILNARNLDGEEERNGIVWSEDKKVVFGQYQYESEKDKEYILDTITNQRPNERLEKQKGKTLLKYYIPVTIEDNINVEDKLVVLISADYQAIQEPLNKEISFTFLTSFICLILGIAFMYSLIRVISKKERTIFNVQEMYSDQINTLYRTVRENKHDSTHHLFTISGLINMKMYDELHDYVDNLTKIKAETNDIVNINIPAFSGLLQAKIAQSLDKRISFQHHFEGFEYLKLDMMKVTNLVRIIGNILDNAFHIVMDNHEGDRKVIINGSYRSGMIKVTIYNNGTPIPDEHMKKIFSHGFTTRKEKGGSGIGLSSSKKIIERYKGSIEVTSDEEWTKFTILMPVSAKEVVAESKEL